ncbi:phage major tail tube protein [Brucella inopinata]|uniref:phage major tail tube protein n=1 Tax=Brucella inopinata TaxID=1218315 RepID=UPI000870CDAC|nr:phage major tail tube protein [Brucella inopinata]SCD23523.1 hypothetical protein BR141012304_11102 [Brucella inopinata]
MKNQFVETANVKRFLGALSALEQRGAQEACLVVIDGQPGLGKTTTLKHWVAQNGCVYLRAKKEWSPSWFMNELLENLRVTPPHSFPKKYAKALEEHTLVTHIGFQMMKTGGRTAKLGENLAQEHDISISTFKQSVYGGDTPIIEFDAWNNIYRINGADVWPR